MRLALHRPPDCYVHAPRVHEAMGGGQHAVRVEQGAITNEGAAIGRSYRQRRHEAIPAVGHRRAARYLGFDASPICRLTQLVPKGGPVLRSRVIRCPCPLCSSARAGPSHRANASKEISEAPSATSRTSHNRPLPRPEPCIDMYTSSFLYGVSPVASRSSSLTVVGR